MGWVVRIERLGLRDVNGSRCFLYVHSISPEKVVGVWQWSQVINLDAMEQIRESGYAALTVIFDSCENRNQNSWGKGQGGDWSDSRSTTLLDGDVVDLSAVAVSPGDEPPEFQFSVQRRGGVFQIRQDWSETPNWTWRVSSSTWLSVRPRMCSMCAADDKRK